MKNLGIFIFVLVILLCFPILNCYSNHGIEKFINQDILSDYPDEIIFYSDGIVFSPVIILQADAEVIWTWDDGMTSNTPTPTKDYGTAQLRPNRLKVTPWSAVRRINIGYDASDNGDPDIEHVADQKVSLVENINLVAPYLKEWCSSYNKLTHLDFSNFTELETIESFFSTSLESIDLTNTNKLKRACFEYNNLLNLDVSSSPYLGDLRAAGNGYNSIAFSSQTDSIWHICVHHNDFTNPYYFEDMSRFPYIADLFINYTYQKGELVIAETNPKRQVEVRAFGNYYSSINFQGAFRNKNLLGIVKMDHNELKEVNITGCVQIKVLDLSYNKLESLTIDKILKQVDDYETNNGTIDLRYNQPPTDIGLTYKSNLEKRGWTVNTDQNIPIESITVSSTAGTNITTDNGTLQLQADVVPTDATTKTVSWLVFNETGSASISFSGLLTAEKDGTVRVVASATDGTGVTGELQITISNQVIPVESISISGGNTIYTDNGTLQLQVDVLPADATTKTVNWSVINGTGRATISSSGLLTAEKDGTVRAVASATDGTGVTGELQITISNQVIPVESISISGGNTIYTDNGTLQLQADVLPADATTKAVIWSVINETGRAIISSSGLLTAEKDGTVRAVASATDGTGVTGELQITISNQVIPVESISISGGNTISTDNGTLQLQAEVLPVDATTKTVNWFVINETGRATISSSGLLTAEKDGTVKAVASTTDGTGVTGELQITISNQIIPVGSISISGGNTISTDNETLQLQAEVLPTDATTKSVNWSVINETGSATISSSGLLTAEKDGTVRAVASATDGSGVTGELQITISNQIIPVGSISISGGITISADNGTLQLQADILPTDATTKSVNWSVINETGSATISSSGLLTAEKDGTVRAVASATDGSGVTGELQITISNQTILIENLEIISNIPGDTISGIGKQVQFDVILTPSDATNQNIDWSVENITGEAIIDSTGLLTTQYPGRIKVFAKTTDESNHTSTKEYLIVIPVGIKLNSNQLGVKIFPNPTEGEIKIQIDHISVQGAHIEIWDFSGQLLMKKKVFEKLSNLSLENFGGNNFLIIVNTKNELTVQKVIKN